MRFNIAKAQKFYMDMFGEKMDQETINIAKKMTKEEFYDCEVQIDEDGEYRNCELSAGEFDCIEAALY